MDVVALFAAHGAGRYGEDVTQLEHALQCAALARRARADDEVVLAALLHDLGHLVTQAPEAPGGHHGHEGAALLKPWVPARVAWLVEHHVVAKRYLCTVDPRYATRLSTASVYSLTVQGAALDLEERLGREIARLFPTDGLVGEEGPIGEARPRARYAWVLDPIDGTNNFARGLPGFAVSVGVLRDGMPFAGAVYDPLSRAGCSR